MNNHKGFTLIELLITVAVIGVLAALAGTAYVGAAKKAARSEAYANLQSLRILEEQFYAENACYQPLVAGACPANNNVVAGAANIRGGFLPGFQPGGNSADIPDYGLSFTYELRQNMQITNTSGVTTAAPPTIASTLGASICFTAVATGRAGTRTAGDMFAIDCFNNRNF